MFTVFLMRLFDGIIDVTLFEGVEGLKSKMCFPLKNHKQMSDEFSLVVFLQLQLQFEKEETAWPRLYLNCRTTKK